MESHAATHWGRMKIMVVASGLNSIDPFPLKKQLMVLFLSPHLPWLLTQITETPPGVKGNTASGAGTKNATLETGAVVSVPSFVEVGVGL